MKMSAKKKKIGIITFTYGDNFGQRLQNYAVQEILKKYDSEVFTMPQIQVKEKFYVSCKKNLKRVIAGSYSNWKRRHDNFLKFDRQFISCVL